METRGFWQLEHVSDERVRVGLKELLASGYRTEARIVAHIAEVEERELHLRDGSESLFDYCVSRLGLSNSEAFHRITAARIARQYPVVFTLLERRELHLTAVCLLRDYLTADNHRDLLAQVSHKTKWQIQELLARRFPRPDVQSRIRKIPEYKPIQLTSSLISTSVPRAVEAVERAPVQPPAVPLPRESKAEPVPARGLVEPTSEARYRIQLNASAALKEKLDELQALTSHSNPTGDLAVLIERAVDLALERAKRKRFAKTNRPRKAGSSAKDHRIGARRSPQRRSHIPNATKREVAERDELRCAFVGKDGHRCTARSRLQFHHEQPWARGGSDTSDNLKILCSQHNRLLAEQDFGARHVARQIAARQSSLDGRGK